MSFHIRREIDDVKEKILAIAATVEKNVQDAVRALEKKDIQLAKQVADNDDIVDSLEVELEEECLKILALHQPVAIDLRYLVAVLKINSDLERIGDLAVSLAQGANVLARQERIRLPQHIHTMADITTKMLRDALDALIQMDPAIAKRVLDADDQVDDLHRSSYDLVESRIPEEPELTPELIRLLGISRSFERIGDHTTNIAEDVIYMINGEIIRHGG